MNDPTRTVEIVGGGLAGLSLGLALRREGVPVTIFEAGEYPRHRVCGEFIAGLGPTTRHRLGLGPVLACARAHRDVAWWQARRLIRHQRLPEDALAISRYDLDARLAEAFVAAGGDLRVATRVDPGAERPGRINAAGRRRQASPWVGLKMHFHGLEMECGLEMHLGRDAYVGLCALPDGAVNVCGLFRRRPPGREPGDEALLGHLRACGLRELAARLHAAGGQPETAAAVAGFGFDPGAPAGDVRLGDASCMMPPFLGNGMAAAFQMAEEAVEPLRAWAGHRCAWPETRAEIDRRLARRFRRRQRAGNAMHGFLLAPRRQAWFAALARGHAVPLDALYHLTH